MTEAAVLMSGLDGLPPAAGAPASPAGTAPGGGFAGVLSQSMQGAGGVDTPPPGPVTAAVAAEAGGEGSPQTGKPLPVDLAPAEEDAAFLDVLPLDVVPAVDVMASGLPLMSSPLPAAELAGLRPGGLTQPTNLTNLAATSSQNPAPAVTVPGTNPLPIVAAAAAPATTESAIVPAAAASAAVPVTGAAANPLPSLETAAASGEIRLPDWQALRMARASGLDARPAASPAASLAKSEGSTPAAGQDVLQMLGLRPVSAAATAASVDGARPLMPFLPEKFPGEGLAAAPAAALGETDASSLFSALVRPAATPGFAAMPTVSVATPVGQGTWAQDMGQRVTWLANQEIRTAQIQLNPAHLGPVEVRIAYGQEQQLSVSFIAHHPQAREALDAALPRLREMFDGQGLNLADVSVSQESFTDRRRAAYANPAKGYGGTGIATEETDIPPSVMMRAEGLFDAYA